MTGEHGWSRTNCKAGDELTFTVLPSKISTRRLLYKLVAGDGRLSRGQVGDYGEIPHNKGEFHHAKLCCGARSSLGRNLWLFSPLAQAQDDHGNRASMSDRQAAGDRDEKACRPTRSILMISPESGQKWNCPEQRRSSDDGMGTSKYDTAKPGMAAGRAPRK